MEQNSTRFVVVTAKVAATGIVLASVGFSCVFAWSIGIHGGVCLAALTVLFAATLEILKPLAIAQSLTAFRQWAPIRGSLLLILGLFACAYSLTSELALMASNRGDQTAERQARVFQELAARERYQRAKDELATLPNKPSKIERRKELETAITQATTIVTQPGVAVAQADPGAASLTVYLGALGWVASVDKVATWLNLVPVLAMELGSALAGVLVGSFRSESRVRITELRDPVPAPMAVLPLPTERDRVAQRLLGHLQANGGKAKGSHRNLANILGADRSTVGRALASLAAAGLILLEVTKQGSVLRLAS